MKKSIQYISLLFLLLYSTSGIGQELYYDEETDQEYEINTNTEERIINAFLEEKKAIAIDFNSIKNSDFPFRLQNKKGNWILFDIGRENLIMTKESKKYSFQFPSLLQERKYITLATRNEKTYIINLDLHKTITKMSFDEIQFITKTDSVYNIDIDGNEKLETYENIDKITVRNGQKWGLIELGDYNTFYISRNFLYNTPEEVPSATRFDDGQLEMMEDIRKNHNVDKLECVNQDGYCFLARDLKTQLWGIYSGEGTADEKISPKYDSIQTHGKYPAVYEVWKDGKVGYYDGEFKIVFEPQFDDFKYVNLDYTYGCALKKGGYWELYYKNNSTKHVDGKSKTIDGLIELWLNR